MRPQDVLEKSSMTIVRKGCAFLEDEGYVVTKITITPIEAMGLCEVKYTVEKEHAFIGGLNVLKTTTSLVPSGETDHAFLIEQEVFLKTLSQQVADRKKDG